MPVNFLTPTPWPGQGSVYTLSGEEGLGYPGTHVCNAVSQLPLESREEVPFWRLLGMCVCSDRLQRHAREDTHVVLLP